LVINALKPCVYSVPFAVNANISIPLGMVMTPGEPEELFSIFSGIFVDNRLLWGGPTPQIVPIV
jgi:hypothetical protein